MIEHRIEIGYRGQGKSEQQRIELGMTVDEYIEFRNKQASAHAEVLRLEKELAEAKRKYFESCITHQEAQR